ncbi:UNVERIFIED_CONTAM: hypothetical protein Sradi_3137000 [Sesamum radiatum]|uniref:Reverse transcriptase domain-containing protein n=1 Tax=Sesamum radiatum TaxID=300843 RepID=A0AAW2RDE1_SESRA
MREADNPMHVDMDKCDFYVHVHDLPLNMMNLGVATLLGNRIGIFRDVEMDAAGCSWGASLRIRVILINIVSYGLTTPFRIREERPHTGHGFELLFLPEDVNRCCHRQGGGLPLNIINASRHVQDRQFSGSLVHPKIQTTWIPAIGLPRGSELNLVSIPLKFTSHYQFAARGQGRRGRPPGRGVGGRSNKRTRGIQLLEQDKAWVHVRKLLELVKLHRPGLVFLSETKCRVRRGDGIKNKMNYHRVGVNSIGKGGGLYLFWRKDIDVWLQSFSVNHIDITIQSEECPEHWRFTGFYGNPDTARRKVSWALLRKLARIFVRPWLCGGDFNEILSQAEKQGSLPRANWQIEDFRACLRDCGLIDLGFQGTIFTWSNHREFPNTVRARLDRAVSDSRWAHLFPTATVSHEEVGCSDHAAVWIHLRPDSDHHCSRKQRWFRFEAAWLSHNSCGEVVRNAWTRATDSNPQLGVAKRIRTLQADFIRWDYDHFGNIRHQIKSHSDRLCAHREQSVTATTQVEIEGLKLNIEELVSKEEILWRQRAKAFWLTEGDRNTRFFRAKAFEQKAAKNINKLCDEDGREVSGSEDIQRLILRYFSSIFRSTRPSVDAMEEGVANLESRVTMAMNEELLRPYTSEEIVHALKQMHPLKSPGPDGMSPIFYQKHWDIVGHDICACVLDFLNNGSLNSSFNFTHVVLIPKISNPSDMSHFRPISLCNVLYKLAAKVIANRLKPLLSSLISTSQSAFVSCRFITDNVLVAYELHHLLMHKTWGKLGLASLKLDVSKAYDRVEWCFLRRVLKAFSSLIRRAEIVGELQGIAVSRHASRVSHLLFANDTLIFCQATTEAFSCVQQILSIFERASGLKINVHKSAVVFNKNVAVASRLALARILGVAVVSKHDKYLGLPTSGHLSQAGRVVLINSVLFTIPSYVMSCFRLPDSFLHEIESMFADFFWGGGLVSKIHWLSWERLCRTREEGGLGFRRLRESNIALLAKQAWRVSFSRDGTLHDVIGQKYFPLSNFFEARLGSKPSFTWRSLLGTRELLIAGLRWKVGDGSSIPIRGQPWLPRPSTFQLIARPATLLADTKVAALITASGVWDHDLIRAEFCPLDVDCILSIELRGSGAQDEIVWHYERNGRFSVRSAYRLARQLHREAEGSGMQRSWRFIWTSKAIPSVVLFAWKCVRNAIPTSSNLRNKGLRIDGGCYWCDEETEDVMHVMRFCNFARLVWALSGLPWGVIGVHTTCTETWFRTVYREIRGPNFDYFLTVCWALWKGRNLVAFEGTKMRAHEIVRVALSSCPAALGSAMGLRPKEGWADFP